ncbi:MAG: hemolysin family protein [bacterium]|nr:hemolysin family protein [bacterium]
MVFFIVEIVVFCLCLVLSACFSGAETALTSMSKMRVKRLFTEGEERYLILEPWLREPNRYLATILVGNNFINILASVVSANFCERLLHTVFQVDYAVAYGSALAVGSTTFLLLVFGEIVPKTYSKEHAARISLIVIRPLDVMYRLLRPFIGMFLFISNRIIHLLGGPTIKEVPLVTEDDFRALVEISGKEGLLEEEEREMIHSIIDFGETLVKEIMTPRVDFQALPLGASLDEARKQAVQCGHSRIPVYQDDLDAIVGILYVKELLKLENGEEKELKDILRKPLFVPETTHVNQLLKKLKLEHNHIAIVVDEYGVTVGLITIEDVLEEIVGDIQDEYDEEPPMHEVLKDGTIAADAKINLDELEEILQTEFPEIEVETLGGFVSTLTGTVPQKGEAVEYDRWTFKIIDADERRIKRILISLKPQESEDPGEEAASPAS